jgi:hypothetical protein
MYMHMFAFMSRSIFTLIYIIMNEYMILFMFYAYGHAHIMHEYDEMDVDADMNHVTKNSVTLRWEHELIYT